MKRFVWRQNEEDRLFSPISMNYTDHEIKLSFFLSKREAKEVVAGIFTVLGTDVEIF